MQEETDNLYCWPIPQSWAGFPLGLLPDLGSDMELVSEPPSKTEVVLSLASMYRWLSGQWKLVWIWMLDLTFSNAWTCWLQRAFCHLKSSVSSWCVWFCLCRYWIYSGALSRVSSHSTCCPWSYRTKSHKSWKLSLMWFLHFQCITMSPFVIGRLKPQLFLLLSTSMSLSLSSHVAGRSKASLGRKRKGWRGQGSDGQWQEAPHPPHIHLLLTHSLTKHT